MFPQRFKNQNLKLDLKNQAIYRADIFLIPLSTVPFSLHI